MNIRTDLNRIWIMADLQTPGSVLILPCCHAMHPCVFFGRQDTE